MAACWNNIWQSQENCQKRVQTNQDNCIFGLEGNIFDVTSHFQGISESASLQRIDSEQQINYVGPL